MRQYLETLKRSAIFKNLERDEILYVLECMGAKVKAFAKGARIFSQNDKAETIGVVLSGEIQTQKNDYEGNANFIAAQYPSDMFATAAAFSSSKRLPFDITAAHDSEILFLQADRLTRPCSKACRCHIKIIESLLSAVADKNVSLTEKINVLTKRTIREKILAFFHSQSKKPRGESFTVSLSRRQMAEYLSVNRSALSKELSKMRDEGILDFKDNLFRFIK